jgi:hypothetical protein
LATFRILLVAAQNCREGIAGITVGVKKSFPVEGQRRAMPSGVQSLAIKSGPASSFSIFWSSARSLPIRSHVEIEQRGDRTFGVKAGSLIGHENDLGVSSAKAGIKLQEWFVRRRREFSDQT